MFGKLLILLCALALAVGLAARSSNGAGPKRTYVVRPGDTPALLALVYGVPVSAIRAANPRVDLSRLRAGQSLYIPPTALPNSLP